MPLKPDMDNKHKNRRKKTDEMICYYEEHHTT
jgi:hypothetical protein